MYTHTYICTDTYIYIHIHIYTYTFFQNELNRFCSFQSEVFFLISFLSYLFLLSSFLSLLTSLIPSLPPSFLPSGWQLHIDLLMYLPAFEDLFPNRTGDFKHWLVRVLAMLGFFHSCISLLIPYRQWLLNDCNLTRMVQRKSWLHASTDQKIPRLSQVGWHGSSRFMDVRVHPPWSNPLLNSAWNTMKRPNGAWTCKDASKNTTLRLSTHEFEFAHAKGQEVSAHLGGDHKNLLANCLELSDIWWIWPKKTIFFMVIRNLWEVYLQYLPISSLHMSHVKSRVSFFLPSARVSWLLGGLGSRSGLGPAPGPDLFPVSLDWCKGKSTGNHGFYHQI